MASTERHHLPAFCLAAIDRQATFSAVIIKAGTDREAQWWRGWDDHPYIRAVVDWCDQVRHLTRLEKRAGQAAQPKVGR
jgi:hypothetical protein